MMIYLAASAAELFPVKQAHSHLFPPGLKLRTHAALPDRVLARTD
jgi:hypothetical protein